MNYEIDITRRCNFSCPGCNHLCNIVKDPSSDMTPEDVKSVVAQINENDPDPRRLIVIGGEPTLHPRCVEYCRYIKEHVRSYSQLRLNTNFSNMKVVAEVEALGYDMAEYLGPRDAEAQRKAKADVHYNSMLSPKEEGIPIHDPHMCFVLRGLGGAGPCGICVHKYRGRLVWCYCPNATSLCKLLRREDEFMFPTLAEMLKAGTDKLCREICVHCMSIAKKQVLAKDTPGRVSKCFASGLEELRRYNESVAPRKPVQMSRKSAQEAPQQPQRPQRPQPAPVRGAAPVPARRGWDASVCDLVSRIGRGGLEVVAVGDDLGDASMLFLDTGMVDRVYRVCRGVRADCGPDGRVVGVGTTIADAIKSGAMPGHLDVAYLDRCMGYEDTAYALGRVRGLCDYVIGCGFGSQSVQRAVHDVLGIPPEPSFTGTMWIAPTDVRSERAYGRAPDDASGVSDAIRGKVDVIMCLTCPQGMRARLSAVMAEFGRLGVSDLVLPFLNPHNVFAHAELDRRRSANDGARAVNVRNCLMGHYGMIRFARDAGFRRVMFVEDDVRFVRPLSAVAAYMGEMPDGANAALDYVGVRGEALAAAFPQEGWTRWGVLPAGSFFDNFTCYTLGRDGIERLVDYFEHCGLDGYRWPVDAADRAWPYLTGASRVYIPRIRLAFQNGGVSLIGGAAV